MTNSNTRGPKASVIFDVARLKKARIDAGLTQTELAQNATIDVGTVGRAEGGAPVSLDTALGIASALSKSLEYLKREGNGEYVDLPDARPLPAKSVEQAGFKFFPDRTSLNRLRDPRAALQSATEVKLVVVGGTKFIESQLPIKNVTKVIFPNPESASLKHYAEGVYDDGPEGLPSKIIRTTKHFTSNGAQVRWYPHMINHALTIADPELQSGWVQIESVLPYARLDFRSCVIVYNTEFGGLVRAVDDTFDEMFDKSEPQSR